MDITTDFCATAAVHCNVASIVSDTSVSILHRIRDIL